MKIEPRINTNSIILAKAGIKTNVNSVNPCLPREMPLRLSHWGKSVSKENCVNLRLAFSLMELLVVIVIIASLVTLAIPAIKMMQKSFDSTGAEGMISAALATARTIAMSHQQYAGVRFQKARDPNNALKANQYMIFIIYEEPGKMGGLTDAFRAIEGYKPIKLPENTGVMDMEKVKLDANIDDDVKLSYAAAFSIIFSPAGKLVIHAVQTRNKDGKPGTDNGSEDDIFNTQTNVDNGIAMFIQDSKHEQGRNKFVIYDCEKFSKLDFNKRYTEYLKDLKELYVNPYTGEIIK
jgi:prepilin-type N-terminal cleavage/methylation domain-containing protein